MGPRTHDRPLPPDLNRRPDGRFVVDGSDRTEYAAGSVRTFRGGKGNYMESTKRAARRAADLLEHQEVSGWKLAKLTADRTLTSNQRKHKQERAEGRVSAAEWAEAVTEAWGRKWSESTSRNYAKAWRRYGEDRLTDDEGDEMSFTEHLWAAEGSEDSVDANISKHRQHNIDRPAGSWADPATAAAPTPAQVVAAVRSDPDVARAIARHDDTREAVEEAAIAARASRSAPVKSARDRQKEMNDAAAEGARSWEDDLALQELRLAAGALAEAIVLKEQYGVTHPDKEAELLDRIDRYRAAYASDGGLTADDHGWLKEQGIAV